MIEGCPAAWVIWTTTLGTANLTSLPSGGVCWFLWVAS